MSTFQVTFNYAQTSRGFQETFHMDGYDTPDAAYQALVANNIILNFLFFRSTLTRLVSIMMRKVGASGPAWVRNMNQSGRAQTALANPNADPVAAAMLCTGSSNGGGARLFTFRGLADDFVKRDGAGNDDPSLVAATINQLSLGFQQARVCMRRKVPAPIPFDATIQSWQSVDLLSKNAANSLWTDVHSMGLVPTPGMSIYFRRLPMPNLYLYRGDLTVVAADPINGKFTVPVEWNQPAASLHVKDTQFRSPTVEYPQISTLTFKEWSERKTGGPTGRRRGRRSPLSHRRLIRAAQ